MAIREDLLTGPRVAFSFGATAALTPRALLRAAGSGVAGAVAAPWMRDEAGAAKSATPILSVGASAWDDLASRLSGHLLRPDDAMYSAATIISAARHMGTRPAGISVWGSPQDAAACVT